MPVDNSLSERLAVALVKKAHVSIWAADRDQRIVLWNSGAEKIYGHSERDALGKNYLELIVDEVERDQSGADCRRIIDTDYRQDNCLAYDHDTSGKRTHMLTNCFRITDPTTGEHYQAEIGIEISDLGLKDQEHRELREVGRERLAVQKKALELRRQALIAGIERIQSEVMHFFGVRKRDLDKWLSDTDPSNRQVIAPTYKTKLDELKAEQTENARLLSEFKNRVQICGSEEDLDVLHEEWTELEPRVLAGRSDL